MSYGLAESAQWATQADPRMDRQEMMVLVCVNRVIKKASSRVHVLVQVPYSSKQDEK